MVFEQNNIELQQYNPLVFANLHEFEVSKRLLQKNKKKIAELGLIIKEHNLHQEIGVCLLHKHFNLFDKEILVRHYSNNKITIKPEVIQSSEVTPYMIGFARTTAKSELQLFPLEFISITNDTAHYKESIGKVIEKGDFLNKVASFLKESQLENLFGISLLPYKLFNVKGLLSLLETENEQERMLTIALQNPKEPLQPGFEITQTLWTFRENDDTKQFLGCSHSCSHSCSHPDSDGGGSDDGGGGDDGGVDV
ncbi:hypothetical protein [Neobacillus sp. CF12]|uniref:hypothetical protein n=1 Tax=Neobacillus sp. CF12 TaxID=3055864 RepID=UPI0025A08AA8|nr:hypothetical protein [Neobacillus sp. CF12]MDM5326829.1 hypothetical protein [Neobacillus sp. CF12]